MIESRKNNISAKFAVMSICLAAAFFAAIFFGGTRLSPEEVLKGMFWGDETNASLIIKHIRLPRAISAVVSGAGLSVSGVLLQSITDNRLAGPNIIGVNAGAGFAVIITMCFFPQASGFIPLSAFLGAFLTAVLIIAIAGKISRSKSSVILSGIAVTAILNALISLITLIDSDIISGYNYFSIGGLSGVTSDKLYIPSAMIAVSVFVALVFSSKIRILCLGDSHAFSLGVNVLFVRTLCIVCAAAAAAAAVSFAGLLGFVGLIAPNISAAVIGKNTKLEILSSVLIGSTTVLLADTVGRTLLAPTEIPVGIIMALIGAPFFLAILIGGKKDA